MVRTAIVDENGVRKGAWSQEEDDILKAYIKGHGHPNWRQLPKFAGLARCGKSCRLRWMNYLRPDVKRGNFSKEEERLIIQLHQELGNKWSRIATKLTGRTDNEIKNHWHTHLKKLEKQNKAASEVQEQSSEASQCVISETKNVEAESIVVNTPSNRPAILESFPLSQEKSCSEFSSLSSDNVSASGMDFCFAEDSLTSLELFEGLGGDFWTQPCVLDNTYYKDGYPMLSMAEGGCVSSYASYYDDNVEFIYHAMQELPGNY